METYYARPCVMRWVARPGTATGGWVSEFRRGSTVQFPRLQRNRVQTDHVARVDVSIRLLLLLLLLRRRRRCPPSPVL
jgi:hypothetical protein